MSNTMIINGEEYVKASAVPPATRVIVVVDRGWIFAGDVTDEEDRIYLDDAVWVFGWESVGFSRVCADPAKADLRKMDQRVDIPKGSEIFRVPVADSWGRDV